MQAHITYRGQSHIYDLPDAADVAALKHQISQNLRVPPHLQKLLVKGKQLPDHAAVPENIRIMLLASSATEVEAVQHSLSVSKGRAATRIGAGTASTTTEGRGRKVTLNKTRTEGDSEKYVFARSSPLPHLPDSSRAAAFLDRLQADRGIRSLMTRHRFRVDHLTELDPRTNTTHSGKLLGLNRNGGAEILLRLRTDDLGGFRDYRGVRSTLVHELAHNVHGAHERPFWDLFNQMSRELAEFEHGRAMAPGEVYIPPDGLDCDSGAEWHGGTAVLGSRERGQQQQQQQQEATTGDAQQAVSVREIRARAAEERSKRAEGETPRS